VAYSDKVLEHYEKPHNVGSLDSRSNRVGTGLVGAPACGDVMKLQIQVDDNNKIIDASFATEWIKDKTVDEASMIQNTEIVKELSLPPVKIHCSVLAEDAIKAAIKDYRQKQIDI
jgi:nitrogen fixation NifU-like protein